VLGAANGSPRRGLDDVVVAVLDDVVAVLDDVVAVLDDVVAVLDDVVVGVPDDVVVGVPADDVVVGVADDVVCVLGASELCVVGASVVCGLGASELCVGGASVACVLGASVLCGLGATVVLVSGASGGGPGGAPEANPAFCVSADMPTLATTAATPTARFIAIPIRPFSDLGPDHIWVSSRPAAEVTPFGRQAVAGWGACPTGRSRPSRMTWSPAAVAAGCSCRHRWQCP
jgi:hypothetical protein